MEFVGLFLVITMYIMYAYIIVKTITSNKIENEIGYKLLCNMLGLVFVSAAFSKWHHVCQKVGSALQSALYLTSRPYSILYVII